MNRGADSSADQLFQLRRSLAHVSTSKTVLIVVPVNAFSAYDEDEGCCLGCQSTLLSDDYKQKLLSPQPLIFPIGRSSATFLVIPARSTVSTTSEMFL